MRQDRGYSLIEVVTALAILGVLAIPLAALLTQGFFHYQRAGGRTQDTAAAVAVLEGLKGEGFAYIKGTLLFEEQVPTEEYPYVTGRQNFYQSPLPGGELTCRIHLIRQAFIFNQEPFHLEVLLIEFADGQGNITLASYMSGWQK